MNIVYSDFEQAETKSKLSRLTSQLKNINDTKDSITDGFVFAKTRDLDSLDILRWEFVTGPAGSTTSLELGNSFLLPNPLRDLEQRRAFSYRKLSDLGLVEISEGLLTPLPESVSH